MKIESASFSGDWSWLPSYRLFVGKLWWLPGRYVAITLPPIGVFLREGLEASVESRVLRHEAVHWMQWNRWKLSYYIRYGWQYLKHGYWDHPMEEEARRLSR